MCLLPITVPVMCLLPITVPVMCLLPNTVPVMCLLPITVPVMCLLPITVPVMCLLPCTNTGAQQSPSQSKLELEYNPLPVSIKARILGLWRSIIWKIIWSAKFTSQSKFVQLSHMPVCGTLELIAGGWSRGLVLELRSPPAFQQLIVIQNLRNRSEFNPVTIRSCTVPPLHVSGPNQCLPSVSLLLSLVHTSLFQRENAFQSVSL